MRPLPASEASNPSAPVSSSGCRGIAHGTELAVAALELGKVARVDVVPPAATLVVEQRDVRRRIRTGTPPAVSRGTGRHRCPPPRSTRRTPHTLRTCSVGPSCTRRDGKPAARASSGGAEGSVRVRVEARRTGGRRSRASERGARVLNGALREEQQRGRPRRRRAGRPPRAGLHPVRVDDLGVVVQEDRSRRSTDRAARLFRAAKLNGRPSRRTRTRLSREKVASSAATSGSELPLSNSVSRRFAHSLTPSKVSTQRRSNSGRSLNSTTTSTEGSSPSGRRTTVMSPWSCSVAPSRPRRASSARAASSRAAGSRSARVGATMAQDLGYVGMRGTAWPGQPHEQVLAPGGAERLGLDHPECRVAANAKQRRPSLSGEHGLRGGALVHARVLAPGPTERVLVARDDCRVGSEDRGLAEPLKSVRRGEVAGRQEGDPLRAGVRERDLRRGPDDVRGPADLRPQGRKRGR